MAATATRGMADAQRSFERQIDELVLSASPSELRRLQDIDARARASGMSFYDACLDSARLGREGGISAASAGTARAGPPRGRRSQRGPRRGRAAAAAAAAAAAGGDGRGGGSPGPRAGAAAS